MSQQVQVDTATVADLHAILELLRFQFDEHDVDLDRNTLEAAIATQLTDETLGFFLVARQTGRVIGVAAVSFAWTLEHGGKSAWLDELFVTEDQRGQGVGTALLRQALHTAWRMGCAAVDLEVDREHRKAERLYVREGFQPLPRSRWVRARDV
jgi:GNAT superfamily N-acetyltransferase